MQAIIFQARNDADKYGRPIDPRVWAAERKRFLELGAKLFGMAVLTEGLWFSRFGLPVIDSGRGFELKVYPTLPDIDLGPTQALMAAEILGRLEVGWVTVGGVVQAISEKS